MRDDREVYDLIIGVARNDDRVRAVVLNGSRADPNAPRDIFQDFDVVYYVTDVGPFKSNDTWIERFGQLMILQTPNDFPETGEAGDGFTYLMQFIDGVRIDLQIRPVAGIGRGPTDRLTLPLLDKDGLFASLGAPDDRDYRPHPPSAQEFADCCNEFWWVSPYVAKGLWRGQICYAKVMLDTLMREQLSRILTWHIGMKTEFRRNAGLYGKYFQDCLEPELWNALLATYAGPSSEDNWDALRAMCDLFRRVAVPLAERFDLPYPFADDRKVTDHLEHVRRLPKDAKGIY